MTLYHLADCSPAAYEWWERDDRPRDERDAENRRRIAAAEQAARDFPDDPICQLHRYYRLMGIRVPEAA